MNSHLNQADRTEKLSCYGSLIQFISNRKTTTKIRRFPHSFPVKRNGDTSRYALKHCSTIQTPAPLGQTRTRRGRRPALLADRLRQGIDATPSTAQQRLFAAYLHVHGSRRLQLLLSWLKSHDAQVVWFTMAPGFVSHEEGGGRAGRSTPQEAETPPRPAGTKR